MGLGYLDRASALRENYFEAVLYINLLYREKAKVAQILGNNEEFVKYTQEADTQQTKTMATTRLDALRQET